MWNLEERCCIGSLKGGSAVSVMEFLDKSRVVVGYADGSSSLFCLSGIKKLLHKWNNHTRLASHTGYPLFYLSSFYVQRGSVPKETG